MSTPVPACMVCEATDVPMTKRVSDDRLHGGGGDLYMCDDSHWCQARAGANVIEALGLPVAEATK